MTIHGARLTLAVLLALLLIGIAPSSRPQPRRLPPAGAGDAILHFATIDRLRAGDGYYDAVGEELRSRRYPTTKVFNWRTPAHLLMVAALSVPVARMLMRVLAFAAVLLTPVSLAGESVAIVLIGILTQIGALATAFRPLAVSAAEVWAGVLIALSLGAYFMKRWEVAAILGVAAIFTRELAAPYCVVCGLLALGARRRNESLVWIVGGLAYATYFGLHAMQVWAHQLPGDPAQLEPWVRWNGLRFILDTLRVNGWLAMVPAWVAALYMVFALAGAASPRVARQVTLPLLTYFLFFTVAGQPFNYYWGFVTAPIWAFAAAHGVHGLHYLLVSARQQAP